MFLRTNLVAAFVSAVALLPYALALTITGPNSNVYWVFGVTNTIEWTYTAGDPTTISVFITNSDNATLNGAFSIAENVPISQESITVTNVTLKPGTGYVVNFVNPANMTQLYAQSPSFTVQPQGTLPYGVTVYSVISYSVSGTATEAFTIVESTTSGVTAATGYASASGLTTLTATASAATGPATATIITKKTGGALSGKTGSAVGAAAVAVVGLMIGAVAVL